MEARWPREAIRKGDFMIVSAESSEEIMHLSQRYEKYGVSISVIRELVWSGVKAGLDERSALLGVRLALATELGGTDYFYLADVGHALGVTEQELQEGLKELGVEPCRVSPAPWITGGDCHE